MDEPTREDRLVAVMTEQFQLVHRRLDVMQQTTDRRFDEARASVAGQFEAMQKYSDDRLASEIAGLRSYIDERFNRLTEAIDSFLLRRPRRKCLICRSLMFQLLGTPARRKRHVVADGAHSVPRPVLVGSR